MRELLSRVSERDMTSYSGQLWAFSNRPKLWILSAVGLAASLASSVIGGSRARREQQAALEAQRAKEAADQAHYLYQKNVSEADTARGRNITRQMRETMDRETKKAQGAAAVGGGTDASVALAKEQTNKVVSDTVAQLAAGDTARQDQAEQQKAAADAQNAATRIQLSQQSAQNTAQMAAGISNAFAQAGGLAMEAAGSKTATTSTPTGGVTMPTTDILSRNKANMDNWVQKMSKYSWLPKSYSNLLKS